MKKDKIDKAITYTHRLLGVRPRSEKELRDRLQTKGFDRETVESVISSLKDKAIIDDFKFARLWVESRMHMKPKGNMLLRKELGDKGISTSIIDSVLSEKKESEDSLARELATKRWDVLRKLPKEKARKRLFDFLARRGFAFDVIEGIIREYKGK